MADSRYARQVLAFGEEGQKKIEAVRVGIVGLGGLGSQLAQAMAHLGVRTFVLVDDDGTDPTSLNRLIGAQPSDAADRRLKVRVAEDHVHRINPGAEVVPLPKNLRSREALERLIGCPVIFGAVDHDGPRLILMELAAAYGAVLIDCATEIVVEEGQLSDFGGRVVVARPGDFCLGCAGEIDREAAKQELETPLTRSLRQAHGYGLSDRMPSPSVVSLNGVIANIAVTEFLVMTTGIREPNRCLVYHGLRGNVNLRTDSRRDDCFTCGYLAGTRDQANIFRYVSQEHG
jgi:molybdopterin-synthase adenylyltransferase